MVQLCSFWRVVGEPCEGGGPRALRGGVHGGFQRLRWRRIRSITSGWFGPMAAMIFMGWPQPLQMPGSSLNVLAMSLAQERLRLRRNSGST